MRAKDLKEVLRNSLDAGSSPEIELGSIFIWGPPGIGKSRICEEVAIEQKAGCIDFRLVLCDPTDLRGLPFPFKDEKGVERCVWIPPDELPRENDPKFPSRGFLFFNDFPTAPPLTQSSAFQMAIRPHQLGAYQLPEGWVVIAAGNRMEDRSGAHRMPKALSNRWMHIELDVQVDDWVDWAIKHEIDSNIIGFLKWKPTLLHAFDPASSEEAFATPRTWEMVNRQLGSKLPPRILAETIEGTVGKGAASELRAFITLQTELPDIDKIFAGSDFVPEKVSLKYALITALATRAKPNQFDRLIRYSDKWPEEFAVLLVKMLVSRDSDALVKCPSMPEWSKKHKDVLI